MRWITPPRRARRPIIQRRRIKNVRSMQNKLPRRQRESQLGCHHILAHGHRMHQRVNRSQMRCGCVRCGCLQAVMTFAVAGWRLAAQPTVARNASLLPISRAACHHVAMEACICTAADSLLSLRGLERQSLGTRCAPSCGCRGSPWWGRAGVVAHRSADRLCGWSRKG